MAQRKDPSNPQKKHAFADSPDVGHGYVLDGSKD